MHQDMRMGSQSLRTTRVDPHLLGYCSYAGTVLVALSDDLSQQEPAVLLLPSWGHPK